MIDAPSRARVLRRAVAVACAPALLAGLAACSTADPIAAGSGAATGPTPVRIGVVANIGGPSGNEEGEASRVLEVWADETNKHGGIGGHPVEMIVRNTREDTDTAMRVARQFVEDPTVVAVVHVSNATEAVVGEYFADSDLPVVGGIGYNPQVWSYLPNWFSMTTTYPAVVDMQAAAAISVGARTVSAAVCAEQEDCAAAVPRLQKAVATAGIGYGRTVQVPRDGTGDAAQCRELISDGTDFVQLAVVPAVGARFAQACTAAGYTGYFGASAAVVSPTLMATPGIKVAGGLNGFPWWVNDPPVQKYRDAMAENDVEESVWAQPVATALWAAAELFARTMADKTGPADVAVTRKTVLDAYGSVTGATLDGLLPQPITFRAGQPAAPVDCFWLYQYSGGAYRGTLRPSCSR
jgi:branched-chain amino acid transport system substrate-binding protein